MINFEAMKYKFLLIEELACAFNLSETDAKVIVENSTINKMLQKSPDFIMHYSIEETAQEIYDEYNGVPLEM